MHMNKLLVVLVLAISVLITACDDESSSQPKKTAGTSWQPSSELQTARSRAAELEKKLEAEQMRNAELQRQIETLRNEVGQVKSGKRLYAIVLILVVVPIVGFVGWVFLPRRIVKSPVISKGERPKCPRCGLEHDPGDTICKSPACKTQF